MCALRTRHPARADRKPLKFRVKFSRQSSELVGAKQQKPFVRSAGRGHGNAERCRFPSRRTNGGAKCRGGVEPNHYGWYLILADEACRIRLPSAGSLNRCWQPITSRSPGRLQGPTCSPRVGPLVLSVEFRRFERFLRRQFKVTSHPSFPFDNKSYGVPAHAVFLAEIFGDLVR